MGKITSIISCVLWGIIFSTNVTNALEIDGSGTGFTVDSSGYILTAEHVIRGADFLLVKVPAIDSKDTFKAKVVAIDKKHDMALLKIDATGLPKIGIGNDSMVVRQDEVWALGFPLAQEIETGLNITSGRITGITSKTEEKLLQTDAAINPGNSGGPLVNDKGEAIGVVISKYVSQQGGVTVTEGINFAVPIRFALGMLAKIPQFNFSNIGQAKKALTGKDIDRIVSPGIVLVLRFKNKATNQTQSFGPAFSIGKAKLRIWSATLNQEACAHDNPPGTQIGCPLKKASDEVILSLQIKPVSAHVEELQSIEGDFNVWVTHDNEKKSIVRASEYALDSLEVDPNAGFIHIRWFFTVPQNARDFKLHFPNRRSIDLSPPLR